MSTKRYKPEVNREDEMLLPYRVEDYVTNNNTVRAIDAYVDSIDISASGFTHTQKETTAGQPAFNPATLLKLYLYGYMQKIHSSRRLEQEAKRNLEMIWLAKGIRPSYKTISDFRKSNAKALKHCNRDFILLCKELSLLGGEQVAVDGSFFKGDCRKSSIYTEARLKRDLKALDKKIETYQAALDQQDEKEEREKLELVSEDLQLTEKLALLKERQAEKQRLKKKLDDSGESQLSLVDEDARLLRKRGVTTAGYNVQIAVDDKHKLIVAEEVTQDGNDQYQLYPMLKLSQEVLKSETLIGLADGGYYLQEQLRACEEDKAIDVYTSIPNTGKDEFTLTRFTYDENADHYVCPADKILTPGKQRISYGNKVKSYFAKKIYCESCCYASECLSSKGNRKTIQRREHEGVLERHREKIKAMPDAMKKRASLVEHPFGTLKNRAGMHHFLMRGLEKCRGEFSLMVLSYNFTRIINILGIDTITNYCKQRATKEVFNS